MFHGIELRYFRVLQNMTHKFIALNRAEGFVTVSWFVCVQDNWKISGRIWTIFSATIARETGTK